MKRSWRPDWPIDLDLVLRPLTRGRGDPVARTLGRQQWWLTGTSADGPASLLLRRTASTVEAESWGPGSQAILDRLPQFLGDHDDPSGFRPGPGTVIAVQWRRHGSHWRVPATEFGWATVVQAVLEQKVTGVQARHSWFRLCRDYGEPAPGPAPQGMAVAPGRQVVAGIPSWWWRRHCVDHSRYATIWRLARTSLAGEADEVRQRLAAVPGVGPWTLAEVGCRAFGDADAVSVGDYHLANRVGFALTGRPRSTDDQLLDLLRPYAGHRHRAVRMIELANIAAPRFGPRTTLPAHLPY